MLFFYVFVKTKIISDVNHKTTINFAAFYSLIKKSSFINIKEKIFYFYFILNKRNINVFHWIL